MKHFFDIGANNGSTFDRFLVKTDEFDGQCVWCFEPSPRSWPDLLKKAEEMSDRFQITLCPFGLGARWGTFPFYQQTISEGDTFIPEAVDFTGIKAVPLPVKYAIVAGEVPISAFILSHTWVTDEITLKLDCEGSEYLILNDLLKNRKSLERCKKIFIEWHRVRSIDFVDEQDRFQHAFAELGLPLELWPY